MLKTLKLIALSAFLSALASVAMAEVPSCPGGGTPVGTISCSGPVLNPVCTEGPPWKCVLKDKAGASTLDSGGSGGGSGGGRRPLRVFDAQLGGAMRLN